MNDLIAGLTDMTHLDWAERKLSLGTPGCFLKAYEERHGIKIYYKLSNYDSYQGVFGHECVNERYGFKHPHLKEARQRIYFIRSGKCADKNA